MTGSLDTIRAIQDRTPTILLAFSCGKDAVATWLECRRHFARIIPFYMYLVPGLSFVDEALAYYEDFFGAKIHQLPHPSMYRMLNNLVFQAPQNIAVIEAADLAEPDYDRVIQDLREELGLNRDVYVAQGVRAADSPNRRASIVKYGTINHKRQTFFPIWDWNKERLVSELSAARVKLPADYRMFGRSFDGVDYRFLEPMKRHRPADYQKVLDLFPLAELELMRVKYARG